MRILFSSSANEARGRSSNLRYWNSLPEEDKLNHALSTSYPENAEIAYYQGKAFKKLGSGYAGDALAAFRQAVQMDEKTYRDLCEKEIEDIYTTLKEQ